MTQEENDRLIEILFYLYFDNKDPKILASNYKNIDNLMNASYEELVEIRDIGEVIADSVYKFFKYLSLTGVL